jgi:hypothetical protein
MRIARGAILLAVGIVFFGEPARTQVAYRILVAVNPAAQLEVVNPAGLRQGYRNYELARQGSVASVTI